MEHNVQALPDDLEEQMEGDDDDTTPPYSFQITAYGADYPVDALVHRIQSRDIHIPTFEPDGNDGTVNSFQRKFIWKKSQCDRFVESLLLGLPVPGIFLVSQADSRLLVLDGQQRLRTLQAFYDGTFQNKPYVLENVQPELEGKSYLTLGEDERRKLDNSIIHATIVRQDEPADHQRSIYMVFERLNTGGTSLQPQEIRVALYGGPFMHFLRNMNNNDAWRQIYGNRSSHFKDHELILRFLALLYEGDAYKSPMRDFLNSFASRNHHLQLHPESAMREIFERTIGTILSGIGPTAFRVLGKAINVAVLDAVMVGVAQRILDRGEITNLEEFKKRYSKLIENNEFLSFVTARTANEASVSARLRLATDNMRTLA